MTQNLGKSEDIDKKLDGVQEKPDLEAGRGRTLETLRDLLGGIFRAATSCTGWRSGRASSRCGTERRDGDSPRRGGASRSRKGLCHTSGRR